MLRLVFTSAEADYAALNSTIAMAEGVVVNQPERPIGFRLFECIYEEPALSLFGR